MARIGIPGRVGPDDTDWLAQEIERRRTWERELAASLPTVVRSIVAGLQAQVALLAAMADAKYAESVTPAYNFTGFYSGPTPSVTLSTPTGRIEIGYGGASNGGSSWFCFSITGATSGVIVTRNSVQTNAARYVSVIGGASYTPSGFRSMILNVPANEVLTVKLEYYAADTFVYFFGGSILANVAP